MKSEEKRERLITSKPNKIKIEKIRMWEWNNEGNNVYTKNRIRIKEITVKERIQPE